VIVYLVPGRRGVAESGGGGCAADHRPTTLLAKGIVKKQQAGGMYSRSVVVDVGNPTLLCEVSIRHSSVQA
jgi:hypothetical protein